MQKITIVTAADKNYFYSLLTLLRTVIHTCSELNLRVDIWDLGMTNNQKKFLSLMIRENWQVISVLSLGKEPFSGAFNAAERNFGWKARVIQYSLRDSEAVLYLDAGVCLTRNPSKIFEIIKNDEFFMIRNNDNINADWISEECKEIMHATKFELQGCQVHGNILGFSNSQKSKSLLETWVKWCSLEKALVSGLKNHRHDQTVLSILVHRLNLKFNQQEIFILESRHHSLATKKRLFFLAHRREFMWLDYNSLINSELLNLEN